MSTDLLDLHRSQIDARIKELEPVVAEYQRLEAAFAALDSVATPTVTSAPVAAKTNRKPRAKTAKSAGKTGRPPKSKVVPKTFDGLSAEQIASMSRAVLRKAISKIYGHNFSAYASHSDMVEFILNKHYQVVSDSADVVPVDSEHITDTQNVTDTVPTEDNETNVRAQLEKMNKNQLREILAVHNVKFGVNHTVAQHVDRVMQVLAEVAKKNALALLPPREDLALLNHKDLTKLVKLYGAKPNRRRRIVDLIDALEAVRAASAK